MQTPLRFAFAAVFLALSGLCPGQSTDLSNVLVLYDFNRATSAFDANPPAYCAPCLTANDLTCCRLTQGLQYVGLDGNPYRSFDGWDTAYDRSFCRQDLTQPPGTLSYDVFVRQDAIASISGVSFDWKRPFDASVDSIEATIFWEGTYGGIQYLSTGPVAMKGVGSWNSFDLDFPAEGTPLPTGLNTSGKQFHVELYAWGAGGNALDVDNVALRGSCAPIPEPGGALLIATAGVMLLLRRRNRG